MYQVCLYVYTYAVLCCMYECVLPGLPAQLAAPHHFSGLGIRSIKSGTAAIFSGPHVFNLTTVRTDFRE